MQASDLLSGSGVYMISTNVNEKFYIGSAINLKDRFGRHRRTLIRNCHPNIHLQNTWNKHENCELKFYILEKCDEDKLIEREQHYIDTLKPQYNIQPFAYSAKGKYLSDDTKKKISDKLKDIPHSLERRQHQAKCQKGLKRPTLRKEKDWPHAAGSKCWCNECREKKNQYLKEYRIKVKWGLI